MRALILGLIFAFGCDDGGDPGLGQEITDAASPDAAPDAQPVDLGRPLDATPVDMASPDMRRDMAPDASPDAAPADAGRDMARPDMAADAAPADMTVDMTADMAADAQPADMAAPDLAMPDMATPDMARPDRCVRWQAVADADLVAALHADVQQAYRPIAPEPDFGGNLNRYTTARHGMFIDAERIADDAGQLGAECVYTGRFTPLGPDAEPDHADINAEHVWPRARMADDRDSALYAHQQSDIHNLYPSDAGANSARGSFGFGVVTADRNLDYLPAVAGLNADGDRVFEPRDARKGDVARATFYFSIRWGVALGPTEEAVARDWSVADPPDARERLRNDRIEAIQGNRNPFADCPALIDRVADFAAFPIRDADLALP